jgi:hypothetical protein
MCAFCEQDPKIIGKFFGYHQCCIDAFIEHAKKHGGGDTDHLTHYQEKFLKETEGSTHFMPCSKHAKQVVKKKIPIHGLVSNRIYSIPFPETGDDAVEEFENWLENN